jgi:hypothetical protein
MYGYPKTTDGGVFHRTYHVPQVALPPAQGWQCPVCKSVWAPGMPGCGKCNSGTKSIAVETNVKWVTPDLPGVNSCVGVKVGDE